MCYLGRVVGNVRPFLQTISIGLVSFGEHYKRNETGISKSPQGPARSRPHPSCPSPAPGPQQGHQGLPDTPPDLQV